MKIARTLTISIASLGIAASVAAAPALAATEAPAITPETITAELVEKDKAPLTEKEKTTLTDAERAELVSKRLDNAKKGIDAASGIVDTLGKIGGWFGFGGK